MSFLNYLNLNSNLQIFGANYSNLIRISKSTIRNITNAPQVGRSMYEKVEFYISLGKVLKTIKYSEYLVMCGTSIVMWARM